MKRSPAIKICRDSLKGRRNQAGRYARNGTLLLCSLVLMLVFPLSIPGQRNQQTPPSSPTAYPPAPMAEPEALSWWSYLVDEPVYGIGVLAIVLVLFLLGLYFVRDVLWRRRKPQTRYKLSQRRVQGQTTKSQAAKEIDYFAILGREGTKHAESETAVGGNLLDLRPRPSAPTVNEKQSDPSQLRRPRERSEYRPVSGVGDIRYPDLPKPDNEEALGTSTPKLIRVESSKDSTVTPASPTTLASKHSVDDLVSPPTARRSLAFMQDLDQVKEEIAGLTVPLRAQSRQSLAGLDGLAAQNSEIVKRLSALEKEVSEVLGRQHAALEELKISQQQTRNDDPKRTSSESLELGTEIAHIKEELRQLKEGNDQAAVADSFYARTLGAILGQNIEALQPGNFEQMSRQVGERLNQLFQLEVPHGDVLRPLRQRAEAVNVALKDVATEMAKINPQAATEIRPRLQQAEALAAELGGLQAQLQNRRATIEATLQLPVSLHAGARQTFLDELGRGIRREIDKLSEPESYFAAELKHLITNDIISVVDVCDTSVAHPGSRPELETALSVLFADSGLRAILPRQGEPFKSGEQEMLRTLPGESRQSKSIAQVVRRGFYYSQNDSETLLRKAGVVVYR